MPSLPLILPHPLLYLFNRYIMLISHGSSNSRESTVERPNRILLYDSSGQSHALSAVPYYIAISYGTLQQSPYRVNSLKVCFQIYYRQSRAEEGEYRR